MAKQLLTNARLFVDGYDLSGNASGTAIQYTAPALDSTVLNSTAQEFTGGLPQCSISHEGFVEYGTGELNEVLFNRVALANVPVTVAVAPSVGSRAFSFVSLATNYAPGARIGEMLRYSASAQGSGELVSGVVAHDGTDAVTATGNGTGQLLGAVGLLQELYAVLHVLEASASDTLDVVIESDNANTFGSPTTRLTFAQMTGVGSQVIRVSGSIADTWFRTKHTLGGTSPSFRYVVVFAVLGADENDPSLPPAEQDYLVLATPATLGGGAQTWANLIGPSAQLGSTTGADTNDPTYAAGPPRFTFGVDDFITFGDALDSTFMGVDGFTVLVAAKFSVADTSADRRILSKYAGGAAAFNLALGGLGKLDAQVCYALDNSRFDGSSSNANVPSGRHVVGLTFNPALARANRVVVWLDGATPAQTASTSGSDGTVGDGGAELRVGLTVFDGKFAPEEVGVVYIWAKVLTAPQVLAAYEWIRDSLWWS